jgi:hypothetical protein
MKPHKGIHRVVHDGRRSKAWAAIIRRVSGEESKIFTDSVYGGSAKAYRAAVAWYEALVPKYPVASRVQRMHTLRTNNRSGITGVYRWPADGSKRTEAYWGAQWVVSEWDKPKRRKFSIALYGERGAKRLATEARKAALETLRAAESE